MTDIFKTFNTILRTSSARSSPNIVSMSSSPSFNTVKKPVLIKDIPDEFDPVVRWGGLLSPIKDQGSCGDCYSQASVSSLADRFSILTNSIVNFNLSPYLPTICDDVLNPSIVSKTPESIYKSNESAHSSGACTGNTIENIMIYLYTYGTQSMRCFDKAILNERGWQAESTVKNPYSLPYCNQIIGDNYDKCLNGKDYAIFFRSIAYYHIYPDSESIKYEIYHWGPVVGGMTMFNSFLNDYDGKSIYMGPSEGETSEGGHAVRIVGWGVEDDVSFWWIANSWSTSWGLNGYFKLKMGVCDIENNVMAHIPDIPGFDVGLLDYKINISPMITGDRKWFGVDNVTGYRYISLKYIVNPQPLISLDSIPDYKTFWAGSISILGSVENIARGFYDNRDGSGVSDVSSKGSESVFNDIFINLLLYFFLPILLGYIFIRFF